ncbi:MAG TPA: stage II sporulation protein M [Acidobacteriota bacterium]|nr:stage II sporulation protein M [Acidobacteriota bacterium]
MDEEKLPEAQQEVPAPGRRAGVLKGLYREEGQAWRTQYRRYFKYAARALGLGFVLGFLYFWLWPAQEKKALEFVVKALKDIPLGGSAFILALTLFYHNARASAVALATGVIPYLFVPIFDAALQGGVLGLLVSIARHQRLDVPRLVVTQILPHGVFELTAVLYATSLGLYLSAGMGKKAVAAWKARKETRTQGTCPPPATPVSIRPEAGSGAASPAASLESSELVTTTSPESPETGPEHPAAEPSGLFRNVVRSFILVVLPLLLIAAFIESFITPNLR